MFPCLKIGHRGAAGYAPENTLASFQRAIEIGVDMIEFDVRLSKDKQLVIIHDPTLDRTTNGRGRVADYNLSQLKKLDAGQQEQIPTLQEALKLINRRTQVNIELIETGLVPYLLDTLDVFLKEGWDSDDFLLSSFYWQELELLNRLAPHFRLGVLWDDPQKDWRLPQSQIPAYSLHPHFALVNPILINEAKTRGLKIFAYTANTPKQISFLKELKVDGIFSDFPDLI